jgi:hypothetical protein
MSDERAASPPAFHHAVTFSAVDKGAGADVAVGVGALELRLPLTLPLPGVPAKTKTPAPTASRRAEQPRIAVRLRRFIRAGPRPAARRLAGCAPGMKPAGTTFCAGCGLTDVELRGVRGEGGASFPGCSALDRVGTTGRHWPSNMTHCRSGLRS